MSKHMPPMPTDLVTALPGHLLCVESLHFGSDVVSAVFYCKMAAFKPMEVRIRQNRQIADSDDAAHLFRSDRAHHSELMPPGRECLIDGLVCH